MKIVAGAKSDVGLVRQGNEDAYLVDDSLFVVADGMGGHIAGDVASRTAVEAIRAEWDDHHVADLDRIASAVRMANRSIWEKAHSDPSLSGMGTTCTAVVVDGATAFIAHVGDSRAYLLRDGELTQITEDHTVVGRMVREGKLRPEEAERHPHRNIITRALGVDEDVDVDRITLELKEGDRLLICSDGLSGMVGPGATREVMLTEGDPNVAAERLVELANGAGGEDNITVVLLDALPDDAPDPGAPAPAERLSTTEDVSGAPGRRRRRPFRVVAIALGALIVLALLAVGGARLALANSWFVGANSDGVVAVYNGLPEDVAGLTLKEEVEATTLRLTELPAFRRGDVERGIRVESREEAEQTVDNLRREAADAELRPEEQPREKTRSKS